MQGHAETIKAHADAFTPEEHMWITAASMYAAGVQEDNPLTDPVTMGQQVGFLGRFVQIVGELCERYVAPALAGFACCAGCYLTADLCVSWMIAGEKALASLAFFGADSMLPAIITSVVGSLGMSAAIILLLSGASLFFTHG